MEQIEKLLDDIIYEQKMLRQTERVSGNIVKEEFHKGALFGIKLVLKQTLTAFRELQKELQALKKENERLNLLLPFEQRTPECHCEGLGCPVCDARKLPPGFVHPGDGD